MLLGGADDYTPAAACRDYAPGSRPSVPVQATTYDGAHHDFDIPEAPRLLQSLQSARDCKAEVEVESGSVRRLDSGETLRDPTTIAAYFPWLHAARRDHGRQSGHPCPCRADVAAFLRETLRPLR